MKKFFSRHSLASVQKRKFRVVAWAHGLLPLCLSITKQILNPVGQVKLFQQSEQCKLNIKSYLTKINIIFLKSGHVQDLVQVTCSLHSSNVLEGTEITHDFFPEATELEEMQGCRSLLFFFFPFFLKFMFGSQQFILCHKMFMVFNLHGERSCFQRLEGHSYCQNSWLYNGNFIFISFTKNIETHDYFSFQ